MEIVHTTYEKAHGGGRTTSTPAQPKKQDEKSKKKVKPTTKFLPFLSPRSTTPQSHDRNSEPSSSSKSQQKIPRKAVPVKKSDIRLRDAQGGLSYPTPTPDLRRKGGFYSVPPRKGGKDKEREIPRSTPHQAPPRPINTNTIPLSPRNDYKTRSMETPITPWPTAITKHPQQKHQKSKSTSNKFVEYIRNSADLFDETRREMTGRLSPAMDQLPLPNFSNIGGSSSGTESGISSTRGSQRGSKSKAKNKRNSADSMESFYCAGPSDKENNAPNPKDTLQLPNSKPKYFSPSPGTVEKLTSTTDTEPRLCRLCSKYPEGIMGLCRHCEEDFTRPNSWVSSQAQEVPSLDARLEGANPAPPKEEIKPTPPLKILKTSSIGPRTPLSPSSINSSPSPMLPSTTGPKLGFVTGGKTLINPAKRQNSHHIVIVDADEEEDVRYNRYQSEAMRTATERTREDLRNWASVYGDEIEHHPQKARRRRGADGVERNTGFYGFYDDILER